MSITMLSKLILFAIVTTLTAALEIPKVEMADGEIKDIVLKYIKNIPDIEDQYILNNNLSKAIARFFKGKISMLPLYKVSLKIDRNPVKIPWTLEADAGALTDENKGSDKPEIKINKQ